MNGALVKLVGEFTVDEQRGPQIIVQSILDPGAVGMNLSTVTITVRNREEQEEIMKFARENPGNVVVHLFANGKVYPTKRGIKLSPAVMDFLQSHFTKVEV